MPSALDPAGGRTLARGCFCVPSSRMAEFEAFYASRIAPILRRHGLTELPWRGRAMPDSIFVRLFEFKNPSELVEKKKAIGEDPAWKKAMRDLGTLFGTRWPVEVIPHSLLLYTAPAGPGTTVQAGPGKRTPAGPGRGAWRNYDVADGLAATYIQSIFQDRDGHLWFGTYFNGVSRYDGRTFTTFTTKDGLADDNVSAILQDREGVLWFGTQKGLSRYDPSPSGPALRSGQAWKTFTTKDGLANDYVHAILQDRAGNLWFGTVGGGVSRYDGKAFTTFTTRDGLGDNWVLALYEDRDGVLWFGTQGGVSRFDRDGRRSGSGVGRSGESTGMGGGERSSESFRGGRTSGRGTWKTFTEKDGLGKGGVQAISQDREGTFWFGTAGGGLSRYDPSASLRAGGQTWRTFTTKDGLANDLVSAIVQDRDGRLWLSSVKGGGITCYDREGRRSGSGVGRSGESTVEGTSGMGSFTVFTMKDGLVFDKISSAIQDREGYLWFGTVGCGVSRYDGHTFNTFTDRDGLGHPGVISLFQDREGELWFGTFGGGVSRYDGRAFTTYTRQDGLGGDFVFSIYQDRQGSLWFGTDQGVSRYVRPGRADGAGTFTTFTPRDGLSSDHVHAICQDSQGVYWFGTLGGGLSRYDGKTFSTFSTEDGRAGNYVLAILQDRKGDLWIGTWGEGVSRADPLRLAGAPSELALSETKGQASSDRGPAFTTFTVQDGLTSNCVYSISQDREGRLWLGTQGGACRYDREGRRRLNDSQDRSPPPSPGEPSGRGTFLTFTQEDGLAPNAVISVLQDPRGHLWFAVDGGGMVRHDGRAFQTLLQKDGLGSNVMSNAVVQDREGNLWFGTIEGATRYRPPTPSPPPIFINAVVADRRYERASQVSIPSSVELTAFEFQGISLKTRPEAMVYRYRLRGHDRDWRTTHARRVEYQDLPRGTYTFEVEAVDRDLVYSSAPATVDLRVRMPYERIGWMSALGIALVLATYQTRRVIRRDRRLRKSNEDLRQEILQRQRAEEERARLDERLQQLEYLYRLRSALGDARSTDEVIRRAGQTLMEVLSASRSGGVLLEHDGREWRFGEAENCELRIANCEIENLNNPNSKFEIRNSKSGGVRYERGLFWGGARRGCLTLFCGVELSEAQERTLLDETAGQIASALEARELEMQILQSSRLVSLGQMAAGVAHELNQPLTVISGAAEDVYLRLAEGIGISEKQLKEKMKDVLDLAERMTGTIEHLRVFSRDISKEPGVPFSVNDAIRSGLRLIETQLRNHSIALHLDLGEGLPPVSGHPHRMEQVFLNLFSNARDALDEKEPEKGETGKRGKNLSDSPPLRFSGSGGGVKEGEGEEGWEKGIWVRTRREGDGVAAEVEDNGVGMDEADRSRVFEPFFTTKSADRGTGLGLSICYAIVRDHGGQIACESRKGEGTVFRVRLPAAEV